MRKSRRVTTVVRYLLGEDRGEEEQEGDELQSRGLRTSIQDASQSYHQGQSTP